MLTSDGSEGTLPAAFDECAASPAFTDEPPDPDPVLEHVFSIPRVIPFYYVMWVSLESLLY